jgi:hypothetical protein
MFLLSFPLGGNLSSKKDSEQVGMTNKTIDDLLNSWFIYGL